MIAGAVLFSPLLLVPGIRRRARTWWNRENFVGRQIEADEIEPVSVRSAGRTVTVVLLVDGHRLRYDARDEAGERLESAFREILSASRPATGIGA